MKKFIYTIAALAVASAFTACTPDIVIDNVNEDAYANVTKDLGQLLDASTNKATNVVELRKVNQVVSMTLATARPAAQDVTVTLEYDAAYAAQFNKEHGTNFAVLPQDSFALEATSTTLAKGKKRSTPVGVSILPLQDQVEATYILPFKAKSSNGLALSEQHLVYLVKNLSGQAEAIRKPGEKSIFCYFEVNNYNPLNILEWEMEDGRLLVDHLVLFAYNINYDREKGEVYCFPNPQCQYILDHYDEVIRPLRDRGVKVIIGLLGNHDESGLAQLSELGCKDFAKKMAAICYGYGFDGINFDDEYSNSPDLSNPLFTSRSYDAGDRLIYECKKLMPDLLMTSYQYGQCRGRNAVDGHEPGEYLDITVGDYGVRAIVYPGMTAAQCAYQSSEFAQQRYVPTASTVAAFRASDYGFWMIFDPRVVDSSSGQTHFNEINVLAEGLYDSKLKKPSKYYPETRSLETKPINW